jgi:hypothetical protein
MPIKLVKIRNIISRVNNKNGSFSKNPELISILNSDISDIIGDNFVYISEFVIAKVKGKINELNGHPEITDEIIESIPYLIQRPHEILQDTRSGKKYLFIISNPFIEIVIEVRRIESGKTEINTLHRINTEELRRLERKFPVVL